VKEFAGWPDFIKTDLKPDVVSLPT